MAARKKSAIDLSLGQHASFSLAFEASDSGKKEELLALLHRDAPQTANTTSDQWHFSRWRMTNDLVTANMTRFRTDQMAGMAGLFANAPMLVGHNTDELPKGIWFGLDTVESAAVDTYLTGNRVVATWLRGYLAIPVEDPDAQSIIVKVKTGVASEVSVGWMPSGVTCSICNSDWRTCPHWPGRVYTEKEGEVGRLCYVWMEMDPLNGAEGRETSLVYRGAVKKTGKEQLNEQIEDGEGDLMNEVDKAKLEKLEAEKKASETLAAENAEKARVAEEKASAAEAAKAAAVLKSSQDVFAAKVDAKYAPAVAKQLKAVQVKLSSAGVEKLSVLGADETLEEKELGEALCQLTDTIVAAAKAGAVTTDDLGTKTPGTGGDEPGKMDWSSAAGRDKIAEKAREIRAEAKQNGKKLTVDDSVTLAKKELGVK